MGFSDIVNSSDIGQAKVEHPNQPILVVMEYVEQYLPIFANEYKSSQVKNEKGLTQHLLRSLSVNLNDNYPFFFDKEGIQDTTSGNSPAIDIDVIAKKIPSVNYRAINPKEPFFAFEAKILGVAKKHRHKEYVIGFDRDNNPKSCGGIERFKKGVHCKALPAVGMIGYVLKYDFDYWHKEVNLWIDDLSINASDSGLWRVEDKLESLENKDPIFTKCYSSSNRRVDGKEIQPVSIYHFWINLQ